MALMFGPHMTYKCGNTEYVQHVTIASFNTACCANLWP